MATDDAGLTAEQFNKMVNDVRILTERVVVLEAWKKKVDDKADAASLAAGIVKSIPRSGGECL
jgi:hypothetical protein